MQHPRAKAKSAYNYVGNYKFMKAVCFHRVKSGRCKKWKTYYLDLKNKEDEALVRNVFILVPEGEL